MKLYFKKIFKGLLCILLWAFIIFIGSNVLQLIANSLGKVRNIALVGIPTVAVWIFVYYRRSDDPTGRRELVSTYRQTGKVSFPTFLKEQAVITDILACLTVCIAIMLFSALTKNSDEMLFKAAVSILYGLLYTVIYIPMDILCWFFVMRGWLSDLPSEGEKA